MKYIKILFLLLLPIVTCSQVMNYHIKTVLGTNVKAKYAYLAMPKNLSSTQDTGKFLIVPINDGIAEFKGTVDLGDDILKTAYIFVDDRANITMPETISKVKEGIWSAKARHIVVEDLTLEIKNKDSLASAGITKGGKLTKEMEEYYKMLDNDQEIGFLKKYPDSPMSLFQLQYVVLMYELPLRSQLEAQGRDPRVYYQLLSERLRSTKQGVALKKRMDRLFVK
ncbi:hypothetical protein ACTJKN_07235 [Pedobacter sp. 22163]|uniref:hypothetical protein n=1 Tax=Pedobacter sp. 22163 TaxID=3453883 RepID=UPI003F83A3C2